MIQGNQLRDAMISASNVLAQQKQQVDELNIFPVPDGDTGTNMSMTLSAAARELARLQNPTVSETADTASAALLRGARGNSGVILSLLFRGFSKGLKGKTQATGAELAAALKLGVEAAYKAVMKPTEGTILTVAREAADKGIAAGRKDTSVEYVWEAICAEAYASLQRTPELLPVLKKAGVVDAGGQGLYVILRAMQDVFRGEPIVQGETAVSKTASERKASAAASFDTDIKFTYCTEFIVARDPKCTKDPLELRAYLESIGDCVVVVDDEEIIKVHVHTNDPGKALSKGVVYGQFETVKVENMRIQHENAGWVDDDAAALPAAPARVEPEEEFGFVAVAAGDGLTALFSDLGCQQVVSGGQTMNPSTDDILSAIEATPAKVVYVLPNNKNIILAAEQAIPLADREVHVLPTRTIPQGIAAMLAFDPDAAVENNLTSMMKAADNVATGSITFAARDSDFENREIHEGDILALDNGKLTFTDTDISHAAVKLTRNMVTARRLTGKPVSFITLLFGEGVTEYAANKVCATLQSKLGSDIEISVIPGGQPVYYYFISIE